MKLEISLAMIARRPSHSAVSPPPNWWRLVVVALSALVLSACRSSAPPLPPVVDAKPSGKVIGGAEMMITASNQRTERRHSDGMKPLAQSPDREPAGAIVPVAHHAEVPAAHPPHAAAGPPVVPGPHPDVGFPHAHPFPGPLPPLRPFPEQVIGDHPAPVVGGPRPDLECLFDGGDRDLPARVTPEFIIHGLDQEDTIGHADTLDGRTIVAPSNRVKIYSPRFAAVRRVIDPEQRRDVDGVNRHRMLVGPVPESETLLLDKHVQNLEAVGEIGDRKLEQFRGRQFDGMLSNNETPWRFDHGFAAFEDLGVIRNGMLTGADKPLLALGMNAAKTWSKDDGVQILVDGKKAVTATGDQSAQVEYTFEVDKGPAKLRVIKIASEAAARPGDTIDFTIRYDNTGDQLLGNVTIVDNLTNRLEYVEGSAQSSRKAEFLTQENEGGALILRWEITDPLPKGDGGLVRFKCRVR